MDAARGEPGDSPGNAAHHTPATTRAVSPVQTVRAATGVARVALTAASGVTLWTLGTAAGVTATVVRGSMAGAPAPAVLAEAEAEIRDRLRHALGLPGDTGQQALPGGPDVREQGAQLLRLAASTRADLPEVHPAFATILPQLTPDEARIMRFLYVDGPQPALDVRGVRNRTFRLEAGRSGITMLGEHAGLRFPDQVPKYLANLRRLGLVEFTREPVDDPHRYQLLEARVEARDRRRRSGTKISHRSVVITDFGTDFVQTCLPIGSGEPGSQAETGA